LCKECAARLDKCPLCRCHKVDSLKVYMAWLGNK
jgi:hypothetical protein